MSIMSQLALFLVKEHKYKAITGNLVLVGRQKVNLSLEQAIVMLNSEGVAQRPDADIQMDESTVGATGKTLTDHSFLSLFSDAKVSALDITDYEGAEHIHDMNEPLPDHLEGIADFILDGGSIDNIFDAPATIRNISRMLRPGGRAVFFNAASYYPSAYGMYPPEWYFDFFAVNNFVDCKSYIGCFDNNEILKDWDMFVWLPLYDTGQGLTYFRSDFVTATPRNMFCVVIAEKGPESTWNKSPVQYHYRPAEQKELYGQAAIRFAQSPRPIFVVERYSPQLPPNYKFVGTWAGSE
jgi:SAM-dependent methyltransferase